MNHDQEKLYQSFLNGKTPAGLSLFNYFVNEFKKIGDVSLYPTKSMIGIAANDHRIAWITQIGKNFIHVVFPFTTPHGENLCFQKIVQVPGDERQFNHHFRMYAKEDVNEEVKGFMRMAYKYDY